MKILYHHRITSKDGQYVHLEEMVNALRRLGHTVILSGPAAVSRDELGSASGMVDSLKRHLPRALYEVLEFGYALIDFFRLLWAAIRNRPDCIYERYNLFLPAGVWVKRATGLPMLLEVNAALFEERSETSGVSLKRLARWTERMAWHGADRVLPVTAELAKIVRAAGVPAERIVVVPNGINLARFAYQGDTEAAKAALGLAGRTVLGFTGFAREWHCLDMVIDVVARAPAGQKRHLLIVGDGPVRASLEAQARALGVADQVTITGVVPRDEVPRYIAAFDVALQTTVVRYASPLKLFEYLAMGRPILSPAVASSYEILTDGENALLFQPGDKRSLQSAIERVLGDEALRTRLGRNARETIAARRLTWDDHARTVVGLVETLRAHSGLAQGADR